MTSTESKSFRPNFGRWLTGFFAVMASVTALVGLIGSGPDVVLTLWPWLALLVGTCWAIFWHPEVRAGDDGVTLVNVWHSIEVPWAALIGVETKWALTLVTPERRYRAWAAPAPGRSVMRGGEHRATHHLKEAAIGGEVRPGDLPHTDSGAAANMVRDRWKAAIATGTLDEVDPRLATVRVSIHWALIAAGIALIALAIAGLSLG